MNRSTVTLAALSVMLMSPVTVLSSSIEEMKREMAHIEMCALAYSAKDQEGSFAVVDIDTGKVRPRAYSEKPYIIREKRRMYLEIAIEIEELRARVIELEKHLGVLSGAIDRNATKTGEER